MRDSHNPCTLLDGCVHSALVGDGYEHCPDGSDETKYYKKSSCGYCFEAMQRLSNVSKCDESSYANCNVSTCYTTPSLNCSPSDCNWTDILCVANYDCLNFNFPLCDLIMQCSDGEMILDHQFCDSFIDCRDGSDELRNQPGFKCVLSVETCILPQRNLYDDVAHCADSSDLCNYNNISCFECLDKRLLVSSKQVCDGVIDCYDLSDECLCETNLFNSSICDALFVSDSSPSDAFCSKNLKLLFFNFSVFETNPKLIYALSNNVNSTAFFNQTHGTTHSVDCLTKFELWFNKPTQAVMCDGRPDCRDFSDECNCENPPSFCNESCRLYYDSFYPLGDFYCDGIENEFAWEYFNESACPRGFDEKLCPKRFYCKSGEKISIDVSQICNDVVECDDGEDEQNCSIPVDEKLFSSDTEMIRNHVFRFAFWINGFVVIIASALVILRKMKLIKTADLTDSLQCQHIIILNISVADFIMGVYLLAIAVHSSIYSGYYGQVDIAWRSSWRCSIIGSLAVISSEASCLLMVVLSAFRLNSTCDPYATLSTRMWPWKMAICA